MNVRAGDRAFIIRPARLAGWIVDVVSGFHTQIIEAPDGTRIRPTRSDCWLIHAARPFDQPGFPPSVYALCSDRLLRPIRDHGDDAPDETPELLSVPSKEKEHA